MMWARFLIAIGLVTGASAANAADVICDKLDDYAKAQWAQKGDPIQRYWVEFHWGIDTDPDTFWSWGYGHSNAKGMAAVDAAVLKEKGYGNVETFTEGTLFQSPLPNELRQKMIAEFEKIKSGY